MKIARKRLSLMLAWLMLITLFIIITPVASFAAQPTDITDHWAKDYINDWVEKGLISGYPDGTFKPDNNITRAEFMALVNRAFGFEDKAEINYSDVPAEQWVTDVVATAKAAGYISGYGDGTMKPNNPITRQEAAAIISRIIKLESNTGAADQFSDAQDIPQWSKGAVGAVAHAKIMQGYGDGSFKAGNYIKRAECVVSLNRAMNYGADGVIYDKAGTYGPTKGTETIDGNVTVKAKDTTLQNTIIEGDLVIHQAVGEGSVTLKKITVQGKTYINGGGKNSIYLIDSQIGRVYVMKESGSVRLVASGATQVGRVLAQSSVKLEESNLTGTGFEKAIVDQQVKGRANIELAGINLESLELTSKDVTVYGDKTTEIKEVLVKASDVTVKTEKGTYIGTLVADGKVAVTGSGTIAKAEINVSGVSFETKPTDIKTLPGVSAPSITTRSSGGGGGGGGGNGGGTTPVSVNSVSVNKTTASIDVGASITLVATVSPSNATNKNVTWSSSDNTVATVDNAGKVTGVNAGTATITVTTADGAKTASCTVTVKAVVDPPEPVAVTGVTLNNSTLTLAIGTNETLIATVSPSNASDKTVTWSSSDSTVVTVDNAGKVTGVKAGTATITVTTVDGGKISECLVTVIDPSIVEIIAVDPIENIINIPRGTAKEELNLPTQVEVTITGGAKKTVDVVWDEGTLGVTWIKDIITYNPNQAGTFTFIGGLKGLPAGVTNPQNMTASVKVIVLSSLEDNTPPVIKLLGNKEVSINVGDTYEDAGATALDDNSGDITDKIVKTIVIDATSGNRDTVDTSEGCNYTIKYNVMDDLDNEAKEVTRKVIVVEKVRKITVTAPQGTTGIFKGETLQMEAVVERQTATNKGVAWSVENDTGTATISEAGLLTAIDEGTVTVKATAKDGSSVVGALEITIYAETATIPVASVELAQLSQLIGKGEEFSLKATVIPANATNQAVTWSSSDETVATVDNTGKVIGIKAGTAAITVKTVDGGKTASCDVTVYDGTLEVTRTTAPFRADATGGDKLEYVYAVGKLTIGAPIAEIPSVKNPSNVEAKWVGVNIPKPVVDVAESGTIHLTIKEIGTQNKVHEGITYGENDPFLYYFGAEAGGRTLNLEMVWNGTHKETLVVEYVDSTVVGEEPLEIVEVSFWNKDLNQILIKTNRLCSDVNHQKFSIDGVNADSNGQPPNYKTSYGFWIGFPKDKLTIGESFTLTVLAGAITDIYGTTNKEQTFVVGTPAEKITPVVNEAVTATAVNVGQTLAASILSGTFKNADNEAVAGTLAWGAPDTKVVATGDFAWTFTPDNTTKYNVVKGTVSVTVLMPVTVTIETTKSSTEFIVNLSPAVTGLTKDNFILKLGQNPVEIADVQGAGGSKYWLTTASLVRKQTYTLTINNAGYHFGNPIEVIIPGAGTISGNVKDLDDSEALLDVKVEVYADVIVGEGKTDAEGNYIITDIIEGIYNITFSKNGYQSRTINNVNVKNDETTVKDVELEKLQGQTYSISIAEDTKGVSVNTAVAEENKVVTVYIDNVEAGKQFKSITVTDSDSGIVETREVVAGKEYTFTMPAKSVTITVELQTVAGAPAAPAEGEVTITQPQEDAAIGQILITMAGTLEFRITNGAGEVVKQEWTTGTGAALTTTANPTLVAGDKLEVRVKAVPPTPEGNIYTYEIKEDDIGPASTEVAQALAEVINAEQAVAALEAGVYTRDDYNTADGSRNSANAKVSSMGNGDEKTALEGRMTKVDEDLGKYKVLLDEYDALVALPEYDFTNPLVENLQNIVKRYKSGPRNLAVRYTWVTTDSDIAYIYEPEPDNPDHPNCELVVFRPENGENDAETTLNLTMTYLEKKFKNSFPITITEFTPEEQNHITTLKEKAEDLIPAFQTAYSDNIYHENGMTEGGVLDDAIKAYDEAFYAVQNNVSPYLGNLDKIDETSHSISLLLGAMEHIIGFFDEYLDSTELYEYFPPPTTEAVGFPSITVNWASSNPDAMDAEGNVTRPALGEEDTKVTLTLTLSASPTDLMLKNEFNFTVLAITPLEEMTIEGVTAEDMTGEGTNGKVLVTWAPLTPEQIAATKADRYTIDYVGQGDSDHAGWVLVEDASVGSCEISGLRAGQAYDIYVNAHNKYFSTKDGVPVTVTPMDE